MVSLCRAIVLCLAILMIIAFMLGIVGEAPNFIHLALGFVFAWLYTIDQKTKTMED